jgi:hypothetical protein
MDEFNIYESYINDNQFQPLPFLKIDENDDDIYIEWTPGSRLDKIAYTYYDNPAIWKLILLANPVFLSEADISVGDVLRLPSTKQGLFSEIRDKIQLKKRF